MFLCPEETFLKYRPLAIKRWLETRDIKLCTVEFNTLCLIDSLAQWQQNGRPWSGKVVATADDFCDRLNCSRSSFLRYRARLIKAGVLTLHAQTVGLCYKTPVLQVDTPPPGSALITSQKTSSPAMGTRPKQPTAHDASEADFSVPVTSSMALRRAETSLLQEAKRLSPKVAQEVRSAIERNRERLSKPCDQPPTYWDALKTLKPEVRAAGTPIWQAARTAMLTARSVYEQAQLGHRPVSTEQGSDDVHELSELDSAYIRRWAYAHFPTNTDRRDIEKQATFAACVGTLRSKPLPVALRIIKSLRSKAQWAVPYGYRPEYVGLGVRSRVRLPPDHIWRSGQDGAVMHP